MKKTLWECGMDLHEAMVTLMWGILKSLRICEILTILTKIINWINIKEEEMISDDALKELRARRKNNFKVRITTDNEHIYDNVECPDIDVWEDWTIFDDEIALSITHNGYQYSSIVLAPHEIPKVIEALERVMAKIAKKEKK